MFQSMFDRLLALFMVVILLVALVGGAFSMLSILNPAANSAAGHAPACMPHTAYGAIPRRSSSLSTPTQAAACAPAPVITTPRCTLFPSFHCCPG